MTKPAFIAFDTWRAAVMSTALVWAVTCSSILAAAQDLDFTKLAGESWYGLYMNGQKVGYAATALAVHEDGTVTVSEDASFKMNMVGMKQDMRIFSKRTYAADGALVRIESKVDDIAGANEFHAEVKGDIIRLRSIVGGQSRETELPKPKETLNDAIKQMRLVGDDAIIGDSITFSLFEPMYQTEMEGTTKLEGVEERILDGVATKVFRLNTVLSKMGIQSTSYVTADGTTLEDRIAGGIITMRLEPEEAAKDVSYTNDVIVSNAARVLQPIRNPRDRGVLELKIRGPLTSEHLFNDERQSIAQKEDHFEFTGTKINRSSIESVALPVTQENVKQWIEPTLFVQSDNPKLVEKAKEIVGAETDAFAVSERLSDWVYDNVHTTFSARLTNALEVLEHMEGDCTEHSMLFIGLARAAGLPAREVAGLIYVEGPQPGFYFHQWATVWVGKWIDVDPTFDQPIADATHIKLAEGDLFQQTKLLPIIGQLKIDVVNPESE